MKGPILISGFKHNPLSANTISLALLFTIAMVGSCARKLPKSPVDPNTFAREITQWQEQRLIELKSESGWLTLIGLFWLQEGENKFGSESDNDIVLPKDRVAGHAGSFSLHDGRVRLDATQEGMTVDAQRRAYRL